MPDEKRLGSFAQASPTSSPGTLEVTRSAFDHFIAGLGSKAVGQCLQGLDSVRQFLTINEEDVRLPGDYGV
jgi:hypothetical protein